MNYRKILDVNSGRMLEFDFDNTVYKIEYTFNDLGAEETEGAESKWQYDYEYRIIEFKEQTGYAIIITHWQQSGMILGCPDCALHQCHAVYIINEETLVKANREMQTLKDEFNSQFGTIEQMNSIKKNNFYQALNAVQMPAKVYLHFFEKLQQDGYINMQVTTYR